MFDAGSKKSAATAAHAPVLGIPPATGKVRRLPGVYLPRHFAARDAAEVSAFVDAVGAADLVTFDGTKPIASLIPVLWDRSEAADGARGWGEQSAGAGKAERGRAQDGGG